MTIKELFSKSYKNHKKRRLDNWSLSLIIILFISAFLFVSNFFVNFDIVVVPFIVLPLFFSSIMIHYSFRYDKELSFKAIFKFFKDYFSPRFFGCFKIIKSFLKAFLVELVISSILSVGITAFYYFYDTTGFNTIFQDIMTALNDESLSFLEFDLISYLENSGGLYYQLLLFASVFSNVTLMMSFLFFTSRAAFSVYPRMFFKNSFPPFVNAVTESAIRRHKKEFNKYYFASAWPLFLLMIIGGVVGYLIPYFLELNNNYQIAMPVAMSMLFIVFYYPFYLSNMEIVSDHFQEYFKKESTIVAQEQLQELKRREAMNKQFEEAMRKMQDEQTKNQENQNDENNPFK